MVADKRDAALRPLRLAALAARRATSPVVCATVEEQGRAVSLLHRTAECGGGGRPRSGLTEGAQSHRTAPIASTLAAVALAACTVGPNYQAPALPTPPAYQESG